MDSRFKGAEFFENLIGQLASVGLVHLSTVVIDTRDFKSHVETLYTCARATTMVFSYKPKALIVILRLSEHVYSENDSYDNYWSLRLDMSLNDAWYGLMERVYPRSREWWEFEDEQAPDPAIDKSLYESGKLRIADFRHCGWSSKGHDHEIWNLDSTYLMPAEKTVNALRGLLADLDPYLEVGLVPSDIPSWEPDYAFPGCASTFWKRFNLPALSGVLKHTDYIHRTLNKKAATP